MKLQEITLFWVTKTDDKDTIEELTFKNFLNTISYLENKDLDKMNIFTEEKEAKELLLKITENKNQKFIIIDWANNLINTKGKEFDTYEEGWDWIYSNVEEESEDDGTYDEYQVIDKSKYKENE